MKTNKKFTRVLASAAITTALLTSAGAASAQGIDPLWKMKPNVEMNWKENVHKGAPSFITGKLTEKKVKTEKDVQSFFKANSSVFNINPEKDLKLIDTKEDELGMTHFIYQPVIQNVPIAKAKVMVHTDREGNIEAVNGEFHSDAPSTIRQTKKLNKQQAIDAAWKHIDTDRSAADETIETIKGNKSMLSEKSDLVVYNEDKEYTLAYHVQLQFASPYPANWQLYINAENGEVLKAVNEVHEATGSGYGVLGDYKTVNTYYYNSTYYLFDTTKPMNGVIQTFDNYNGGDSSLPGYYVTDTGNTFYSERQKAAVDAHYYAGEVYDYYYNKFGRNSYDNQGSDVTSTVHYGSNYNNAAWIGNQMIYGDGDGSTFAPLSGADDIVAHELTHAVTDTSADLVYESQSGALNESFSDVFGFFVDSEDWLMGEDVYTPGVSGDALRSMSNPEQYNQPAHMNDYQNLPVTREGDWGGVHTNSGIPNKAAYYTINSIGKTKAENIYYRALTVYLTPYSDFSDARQALVQSANDLYGSSTASSVASAWSNVGVY
ncbi:M4 family metallopeptidase [Bacillus salacetis]|uniref:M4 family metallopeptidase n=1 Tax=Bacillus salacetis TaxID=2315464 RepID=UPI003BA38D1D